MKIMGFAGATLSLDIPPKEHNNQGNMFGMLIVLVLIVFFIMATSLRIVPKGGVFIKERLGREAGTLKPGLHFIFPFIETTIRQKEGPETSVFSVGPIRVNATYVVKDHKTLRQNVGDFAYAFRTASEARLKKYFNENLNVSTLDLAQVEGQFLNDLKDLFMPWGVDVTSAKLAKA